MKPARLAAIRARLAKSSPEPWRYKTCVACWPGMTHLEIEDCGRIALADAKLIAHARADIRALLAEVDRLREALTALGAMDMQRDAERDQGIAVAGESEKVP